MQAVRLCVQIGRAHKSEECWNILRNGTPYYLARFLIQHLLGLLRDGVFPAVSSSHQFSQRISYSASFPILQVVGVCVLQLYLQSDRANALTKFNPLRKDSMQHQNFLVPLPALVLQIHVAGSNCNSISDQFVEACLRCDSAQACKSIDQGSSCASDEQFKSGRSVG